jgi:hypothetical protein
MTHTVHSTNFWYINVENVHLQEAKEIQMFPGQSELALRDLYVAVDDDISV